MNKLGRGLKGDAHIEYTLSLPVSEEKNFKVFRFCSYVPICDSQGRRFLTPGASYEQTGLTSTRRSLILNIKALGLLLSEKKNFEVSFFVSMFKLVNPGQDQFGPQGHQMSKLGRGPLKNAKYPVSENKNFEISFFVHMFKIVTPAARSVLIQETSNE